MDDFNILFRKGMSVYMKTGFISECFYHRKDECKGKIKQSHSIQRNGRLSIIEGDINGQKCVYSFKEFESAESTLIQTLKPIGKAKASTFFGFCDYHDTHLFSSIENYPFENNDEHCFLHSYRSFAHEYHIKKQQLKAFQTESEYTLSIPRIILDSLIQGAELAVRDGNYLKEKLDYLIENRFYDYLDYLVYEVPYKIPIACSTALTPNYTYKGTRLNNCIDIDVKYSYIMMTVLPDVEKTIVILAVHNDDVKALKFLDDLGSLPPLKFEKAISGLLISAENTFISPSLWNSLTLAEQRVLCNELLNDFEDNSMKFPKSKFNFFDIRFSEERLTRTL